MEGKFQTSFIPKKSLAPATPQGSHHPIHFFSIIAYVIFLTVLILGGTVFVWKSQLQKKIADMKTQMEDAQRRFQDSDMKELIRVDTRIESVKSLLAEHLAFSNFFDFLEGVTLRSIQFNSFNYTQSDKTILITMDGTALNFASLALQADELAKHSKELRNVVFSNLNLDAKGNVIFRLTAMVDPALVSYKSNLRTGDIQVEPVKVVPTVTASSTATSTPQ